MTENTIVHADLDLLAERVERAAALVQRLRDDKQRLERERDELVDRLQDSERRLQGQDAGSVMAELQALRLAQRQSEGERRELASRIEALVKKLEKLEI